jgi:iron complex transport system substrate-binding protein
MRICSLLPSITEILFELGRGDSVVGVTHECDWPPQAQMRSQLTSSRIRTESCTSAEIDAQVRRESGSLYELDATALASLKPDLILTQSLCPVCAVDETQVREAAASLTPVPLVQAYHPMCLADVIAMIRDIAEATDAQAAGAALVRRFERAIDRIRLVVERVERRPEVVCLEWTDPPFACGHWTPELVGIAGGDERLGRAGQASRRVDWHELHTTDPAVLLVAPCGLSLARTVEEISALEQRLEWESLSAVQAGRVYCSDGSAYFNRPGPRLIETLNILAEVLHPQYFAGLAPPQSFQRVQVVRRSIL